MGEIAARILEWWCSGDTGISSEAIVFVMNGLSPAKILDKHWSPYPRDADDFGRCHRLLIKFPEYKTRINEMKCLGGVWGKIAKVWGELEVLYQKPDYTKLYKKLSDLSKDDDSDRVDLGNGVSVSMKPHKTD